MPASEGQRWLAADAKNRAWRSILHGIAAVVALPAADAALQAVTHVLVSGQPINWQRTGVVALMSAVTAAFMSLSAYVHRAVIDPSPVPSAQPPRPPLVSEAQAPATVAPAAPSSEEELSP